MAERPPKIENLSSEPQYTGGWHQPERTGAWHPPTQTSEPAAARTVPTLPRDLDVTPEQEGAWHLPRPEDTIFSPQDQTRLEETPAGPKPVAPEDMLLMSPAAAAPAPPRTPSVAPEDMLIEQPAPAVKPPAETEAEEETVKPLNLLELEEEASSAPEETVEAEDDTGGMGMSELIALASLIEQPPKTQIVPGPSTTDEMATAAQPAAEASAGLWTGQQSAIEEQRTGSQAESYAQEQLRRLGLGQQETGAQPAAVPAQADQAENYAQEQLRRLGIATGEAAAVPLTAEQQALSRRFQETEEEVRALREALRTGQLGMTRDQLQERLRQLMVLDDNRVWWMMGIETDQWYRHDNGQWVPATPPYAEARPRQTQGGTPFPVTSEYTGMDQVAYPPSGTRFDQEYTQPSAAFGTPVPSQVFGTPIDEGPLPRGDVPINDPDRTMVGTVGVYGSPVRPSEADTIPNLGQVTADTLYNQRVAIDAGDVIAAPGPLEEAEVAPDYARQPPSRTYDEVVRSQRQRLASNLLRFGLIAFALVLLLGAGGVALILLQYSNIASQWDEQVTALANYRPPFQTARILDVNGDLIAELNSPEGGARTTVQLKDISPFMIHAVVSLENERFFEDPGWDWIAIIRAFLQNLGSGGIESGASTITQQIARQLVLRESTVTPERKLQEIVIASEIAKRYSKNDILQLYLNEIYFGNQAYGVEAAAQFYFGVHAADLDLPQAALLTAMISAPSIYDPVQHADETLDAYSVRRTATLERMNFVIQQMQRVGCLQFQHAPYLDRPFCVTQQTVRDAAAQKAVVEARSYDPREANFRYPHFVQFVQQIVDRDYPGEMFRRGFIIKTTLHPTIQDAAQTALVQQMRALIGTNITTGSIMVTDPRNGAIRAMVGSPDFNSEQINGQVNGALTWQQPGSAIKPVVYTAALEGLTNPTTGQLVYMTPATILWDVPTTFNGNYQPVNFDGAFRGPIALRHALQESINVPAVKTYAFVGPTRFQDTAARMGLRFPEGTPFGLATGLGAAEVTLYDMMAAYGTLANNGVRAPLYAVESITDASGATLTPPQRSAAVQAVQPQIAFLMQNILSDDTARAPMFGANGPLTISGLPASNYVAAKTGTTNGNRDLWTLGFTRNAVVGVWLGRPDDRENNVQGGGYAAVAPLWNTVMSQALRVIGPPQPFMPPEGVIQVQICADTGTLPPPNCSALRNEIFAASQPPPAADQSFVQQVAIDTWTGLRANQNCPDNTITGTFVNLGDDPAALAWLNSAAGAGVRQRLGLGGDVLETVPPAACDLNTDVPIARILSPADNSSVSGTVTITGTATATNFNRFQLEVAPAGSNNYTIVVGPVTTPQTSGTLGTWDSTTVPNGAYTLRLSMISSAGGYLYRTVTINVNNIPPTPTPTPPPTALPLPTVGSPLNIPTVPFGGVPTTSFFDITPIPFDTVPPP